jgi:arabinogalactan oligomer/maltooligosaccharide transport system permease protein
MEKAKRSAILSALFMGLGQFFNREWTKGIMFLLIEVAALFNINYFINSIYGLITLGDTPQKMVNGVKVGQHSINMMVDGIIAIFIILIFLGFYALNIRDAHKSVKELENGKKPLNGLAYIHSIWDKYFPYIMTTPSFLFTTFFILLPIVFTIAVAFTNYSSPNHLPPGKMVDWVGLENFVNLANLKIWNSTFITVGIWTLIFAVVTTVLNYTAGLLLAILINSQGVKLKRLWRTIFILPYAIPAFISLLVMRLMFSGPGPVNNLLAGIGMDKIAFFTDPFIAKVMILVINLWVGAPYFMALMAGVLTNIDKSLYEAAEIDGATKFQQFFKITLPLVLFQTMPLLIMTFAYNFNNFSVIYLLTDGSPINGNLKYAGDTDILISWIYKMTKDQNQFHMASVITIVIFVFVALTSIYSFSRTKSFKEEDMM